MEYERLNCQLKIHWRWLRNSADPVGVYKVLKLWIDTDTEGLKKGKEVVNEEELKKVIEEYGMREGFDDVLNIISDLIEERGDKLDYSIKTKWRT